jgi:hypothetical protein
VPLGRPVQHLVAVGGRDRDREARDRHRLASTWIRAVLGLEV